MPGLLDVAAMKNASILHPLLVAVGSLAGAALAGPVAGVALAVVGLRLGVMFAATAEPHEAPARALQPARA
jgi:hypothetical protein